MRLRYTFPIVGLLLLLAGCSGMQPVAQQPAGATTPRLTGLGNSDVSWELDASRLNEHGEADAEPGSEADLLDGKPFHLPTLEAILKRGMTLVGTPYRPGGTSAETGFDCSGFINYLFREEAGIKLPRSSRDLVSMPAPSVDRGKLKRGDLLFFASRGRVSHTGIYLGDDQFLHSSSSRSGGVRVDKLSSGYWNTHYLTAKRVELD